MAESRPPLIMDLGNHSTRIGFTADSEPAFVYPNKFGSLENSDILDLPTQAGFNMMTVAEGASRDIYSHVDSRLRSVMKENPTLERMSQNPLDPEIVNKRVKSIWPLHPLCKYDNIDVNSIIYRRTDAKKLTWDIDEGALAAVGDRLWGLNADTIPFLTLITPGGNQKELNKKMLQICFEQWLVDGALIGPSPIFQAASMGANSNIIVDCGESHTSVTAVVDGVIAGSSSVSLGVADLSKSVLKEYNDATSQLWCYKEVDSDEGSIDNVSPQSHNLFQRPSSKDWSRYLLRDQLLLEHSADLPDGTRIELSGWQAALGVSYHGFKSARSHPRNWNIDVIRMINDVAKHRSTKGEPSLLIMTGGGTLLTGFEEMMEARLYPKETLLEDSVVGGFKDWVCSGPKGRPAQPSMSAVNPRHLLGGSSRMWRDIRDNPLDTKKIMVTLGFGLGGEALEEQLTLDLADKLIFTEGNKRRRTHQSFIGASMVSCVSAYNELSVSLEEYLEKGVHRIAETLL